MKYRIYADGEVAGQDDFAEIDAYEPYCDDYHEIEVPDLVVEHIEAGALGK